MNDKQKKAAVDGVLEFYDILKSLVYAIQQTPSLEEVERDSMILFASEIKNTFSNTLRDLGVDVPKILTDNLGESMNQRMIAGKAKEALLNDKESDDRVYHPSHYTWLKDFCGIEVIDITRHLDFNMGNAIKYILRQGHKSEEGMSDKEKAIEDLKKAIFYINDKIKMLENE